MCYIASVKHNRLHFQVHCVSKYSVRLDRRLVGTTRTLCNMAGCRVAADPLNAASSVRLIKHAFEVKKKLNEHLPPYKGQRNS